MIKNSESMAVQLLKDKPLLKRKLVLDLAGYKVAIVSNSAELLKRLQAYFAHVFGSGKADVEVVCIESAEVDAGFSFIDWKREPGKTGRKDAYHDLVDGRLVLKVRTGMLFLQSAAQRIAVGPCIEFDNQVINFINAQYMNWLQQHGHLICHASGLVMRERCLAIAGFSGGGKSTLMLHLLAKPGVSYLTNDRLFLSEQEGELIAIGIPKLPRVNPGTIVHDPLLRPILSAKRREELLALPQQQLWQLEEKYDVDVQQVYGENKIKQQQQIDGLLIINWSFNSEEPCQIEKINISQRQELLSAVMKSPGPFYQFSDGRFFSDEMQLDKQQYLQKLKQLNVYEATGKVDFEIAMQFCLQQHAQ